MEVGLEVLQAADEMVVDIPRVEDAGVVFGRHADDTAETFAG